jgi:hypothetical protein
MLYGEEHCMSAKSKAFAIWLAIPFLGAYVVAPLAVSSLRGESLHGTLDSTTLLKSLAYCTIPAMLGTVILWAMPIRRPISAIFTGSIVAIMLLLLFAIFDWTFSRGFESRATIYVGTITLLVPSGVAGACAGYLRSRVVAASGPPGYENEKN